ncbi:hypothetical protein CS022_14715 [Veronia nyctiphanis]|uniref:Uncharacterized protein n=1 Tax=Veronia nyctiphanis TaxID=1278244 RepID=A0A4Q0YU71_9GAMM|nr:hypothetical protein [Veronia nyctiphanis]RXJ72561.1 hypothetical protein CS022_14715 [Veronia nyctiphanis]
MLTKRKEFGYVLLLLVVSVFLYILFVKKIEVVAPGTGLTGIKESNVNLKAPESSYIVEIVSSQGTEIRTGEPLLRYRNMADEYQLDQITQELNIDKRIFQELEDERCFLLSDRFSDSKIEQLKRGCSGDETSYGAGGSIFSASTKIICKRKNTCLIWRLNARKKQKSYLISERY